MNTIKPYHKRRDPHFFFTDREREREKKKKNNNTKNKGEKKQYSYVSKIIN